MQRVRMGQLAIKRGLEFSEGKRPVSGSGWGQKGQPGSTITAQEETRESMTDELKQRLWDAWDPEV